MNLMRLPKEGPLDANGNRCAYFSMAKICDLDGVREYSEGQPVELWFDEVTGRLVIIARNGGGYDCTNIDLHDLLNWLRSGPAAHRLADGTGFIIPALRDES